MTWHCLRYIDHYVGANYGHRHGFETQWRWKRWRSPTVDDVMEWYWT